MTLARRAGVDSAARQAACGALMAQLAPGAPLAQAPHPGLQQVRVVWADLHGTLRGKTLVLGDAGAALQSALSDGVGMVSTMFLKDTSDRTAFKVFEPGALSAGAGFGPANNALLLPDPTSLRVLPWASDTAWLRADALWADGSPVLADPRQVLLRALDLLKQAGYGLQCGLEVEFHIFRITDDGLAAEQAAWPAEPPSVRLVHPGYQLLGDAWADLAHEPLAIVRRTALGLGLPLRTLEIELGPSQFEAVFAPTDALTAADQMVLFRNGVRQALRRAGYHASFVCKPPLPHAVASGWHLHQSLLDSAGHNAMQRQASAGAADDARQVLSDTGAHWLAGLLHHASGMAALCAPTIPAYERFQGGVMAPPAAHWGRDNRGALLRVLGAPQDPATRIENRLGEPMANPYLMIAAQIWAGLDGLQRKLDPGPATQAPYASAAPALPGGLLQALDALAANPVLQQGLGPVLAGVFDTVKRQELARFAAAKDPLQWQRCEYFARF